MAMNNGYGPNESEETELKSRIESLEAERESLQGARNELEDEMCKLRNDTKEQINLQRREISKLKADLEEKEKRIESLQSEIEKLKADLKGKEESYYKELDRLYVSQLAFLFERAVCSYVLPDVYKDDQFASIKSLLGHLNGNVSLPFQLRKEEEDKILSDGRRRWEEICDNLQLPEEWKTRSGGWNIGDRRVPDIFRAIGYLKQNRVTVAHPSHIKLSEAKEKVLSDSIKEQYKPPWQYKLIKDFIRSPRTQEYLKKGNLDQNQIDLN